MKLRTWVAAFGLALYLSAPPTLADQKDEAWAAFQAGDYDTALSILRPLAEQGDVVAQGSLGFMYDNGRGVPQDYAEAVKWYRKAAEQGDAFAQGRLGFMYDNGYGVPQDYAEAVKWYRKAAEQGDAVAQTSLGVMYYKGYGVPQDYVQAHMWFNLAAAGGDAAVDNAADSKVRDILAKKMTPDQLAEAQRMAREWVAAHSKQ